jgi:hypothetical protein
MGREFQQLNDARRRSITEHRTQPVVVDRMILKRLLLQTAVTTTIHDKVKHRGTLHQMQLEQANTAKSSVVDKLILAEHLRTLACESRGLDAEFAQTEPVLAAASRAAAEATFCAGKLRVLEQRRLKAEIEEMEVNAAQASMELHCDVAKLMVVSSAVRREIVIARLLDPTTAAAGLIQTLSSATATTWDVPPFEEGGWGGPAG